jgi:hypothetical protein
MKWIVKASFTTLTLAIFSPGLLACDETKFLEVVGRVEANEAFQEIRDCEDPNELNEYALYYASRLIFIETVAPDLTVTEKFYLRLSYLHALALKEDWSAIFHLRNIYKDGAPEIGFPANTAVANCFEALKYKNSSDIRVDVENCLALLAE